jgi:hypothetical protein
MLPAEVRSWAAEYSQHGQASEEQPLGLALRVAMGNLRGPKKGKAGEREQRTHEPVRNSWG